MENTAYSRLATFSNKLLDKKRIKKIFVTESLTKLLKDNGGEFVESPSEVFYTKAQYGFELMLMLLMDDENSDRS